MDNFNHLMDIMIIEKAITDFKKKENNDWESVSVYDFLEVIVAFYKLGYMDSTKGEMNLREKISKKEERFASFMAKIGTNAVKSFLMEMMKDEEISQFLKEKRVV